MSGTMRQRARFLGAAVLALALAGCTGDPSGSATGGVSGSSGTTSTSAAGGAQPAWGAQWSEEQRRTDPPPVLSPVALRVPFAPSPLDATDELVHLTYELEITNTTAATLTVDEVAVADPSTDEILKTYEGDEVTAAMARVGSYWFEVEELPAGQTAVFFVDVTFEDPAHVPDELVSTVAVTADLTTLPVPGPTSVPTSDTSVPVSVNRTPVPVIGPPLAGAGWTAFEGCCQERTHHRFAAYSVDGNLVVFERYAIDFVQLGADGQAYSGENVKESYHGYGADILAVGDGTVVAAVDGLPENEIGDPDADRTLAESMGNHVILDLGDNVYVMYAHLQPGGVRVEVGDTVTRGQVIGKLGNSGQSTNPHLHFHVLDNPTGSLGEGIPFVIDTLSVAGTAAIVDPDTLGIEIDPIVPPSSRTDEYPLTQTVVDFPAAAG